MGKYNPVELFAMARVLQNAKADGDNLYGVFVREVSRVSGVPVAIVEQKIEEYANRFDVSQC